MSWWVHFAAKSKADAKASVRKQAALSPQHFIPSAADAICAAIDLAPDALEGRVLLVKANGHKYDGQLLCEVDVRTLTLAESAP